MFQSSRDLFEADVEYEGTLGVEPLAHVLPADPAGCLAGDGGGAGPPAFLQEVRYLEGHLGQHLALYVPLVLDQE